MFTSDQNTPPDEEFSLIDILLWIARARNLIIGVTVACVTLALSVAVFSPRTFTASAKVVRETPLDQGVSSIGGLSVLRGMGINLGGGVTGLSPEIYPDILTSREVLLEVLGNPFYFSDLDTMMTLMAYYNRSPSQWGKLLRAVKNVTIGLPRTLSQMFTRSSSASGLMARRSDFTHEEVQNAVITLLNQISTAVDRSSGVMRISVVAMDPILAANVVNVLLSKLQSRIRFIYTQKSNENLDFVQARLDESQTDLDTAENELARFMDSNRSPQTAQLRMEMARYERRVSFQTRVFGDLQSQVIQAEIELQKSKPVITIIEMPVPPTYPTGPRRKLIVFMGAFLGVVLGVGAAFLKSVLKSSEPGSETARKLAEIKEAFAPKSLFASVKSLFRLGRRDGN